MSTAAEMILEEQRGKVAGQSADLVSVRGRATGVASAAGLVAAVLSPHFFGPRTVGAYVALGLTVGVIAVGVWIAYPRSWASGAGLDNAMKWEAECGLYPNASVLMSRQIVSTLQEAYLNNWDVLEHLNTLFTWQCVLFALQLVA